jgi:hypothetical protein
MNGLSRGSSENTSNAFITLNGRLTRRSSHGKRSMFETAHGKEPFPRRRGTAGWYIDSLGKNSPVRMWCSGRSPMLTGRTVNSNPSSPARSNLVQPANRKNDPLSKADQRSASGCTLGARPLLRKFRPVSRSQSHKTPCSPNCAHE